MCVCVCVCVYVCVCNWGGGYCTPHFTLLFKLNTYFLQFDFLFSWNSQCKRKKLINNYIQIKRFFKDVVYLFCCQGHLKNFLESYWFSQKSGSGAYSSGWGERGSCCLCHYDVLRTKIDMSLTPYILTLL